MYTDSAITIEPISRSERASQEIIEFLKSVDSDFYPPLSTRIDLTAYVEKVTEKAFIVVAREENRLIGIAIIYANNLRSREAHMSLLGVSPAYRGRHLGRRMMEVCIAHARKAGMHVIRTETASVHKAALRLYSSLGFEQTETVHDPLLGRTTIRMIKRL